LSIHEAALVFLMKRQFRPKTRFRAAARRIIIEQRRMRKEASKMQGQVSIESQDSIHKSKPKSIKGRILSLNKMDNSSTSPRGLALHHSGLRKDKWKKFFLLTFFTSICGQLSSRTYGLDGKFY
ncbi:uncharacterized protein TNCT_498131, partial [Trichonephila clavata]